MMELPPFSWNEKLEKGALDYIEATDEERKADISDRLADIGVDRNVLTSDIVIHKNSFGFELLIDILKDNGSEFNVNKEKLLFSQFSHIGIVFSPSEQLTCIILSSKNIVNKFL